MLWAEQMKELPWFSLQCRLWGSQDELFVLVIHRLVRDDRTNMLTNF